MPWPVHPTGFFGARGDQDTYRIERSLRFNDDDGAYLSNTSVSPTDGQKATISLWYKRGNVGGSLRSYGGVVFAASNTNFFSIAENVSAGGDELMLWYGNARTLSSTAKFRDPSAWYHLVIAFDSTQATASNRCKVYINGIEVTSWSTDARTNITLNSTLTFNTSGSSRIISGYNIGTNAGYFDGYLAEYQFVDGQTLTPSSFGETDAITGRWKAKAYTGTYGTNGFYLKFADNSGTTSTTLGKDSSPNGNNWTPNNFSVTAGAGNDSLVDSPTNYGTDTGLGGEVRGNYCTWNPLVPGDTAANGNLDVTNDTARGNQELMKYNAYWEVTSTGGTCLAGIISTSATSTVTVGSAKTFGFKLSQGGVFEYANVTDGSSFTSQATAAIPPLAYASTGAGITASLNAGQRPFVATAPSGFKALCTTNLPIPSIQKPSKYMDVVAYTGTGASNSISSLGFSPDLVWIKNRGGATSHAIYDTTRGTQNQLSSDTTGDAVTSSSGLTAFGSNGFTIGTSTLVNTSGTQYVAWAWDEAPTAGMDVVAYTGNGANRTIAHNLGVAPKMIIVKARTTAGADQGWPVYHASNTAAPETDYLLLNSDAATADLDTVWNDTAPTSSVFSVGTSALVNTNNDTYIAYCFSEIEGFSKFGSYTGNGSSDGPFVWCGFRPAFVMIKGSSFVSNWFIQDYQRSNYNLIEAALRPNLSNAEVTGVSTYLLDTISNGFKLRTSAGDSNTSSATFIFAAFAEAPFKYARAR